MSKAKKQGKLTKGNRIMLVSLLSTFGIAFALFGIQLLFELLSIESSILYTVLFLIVGVAMLFGARQLSEKLIDEK